MIKAGDMVSYHPVFRAESVGTFKLLRVERIKGIPVPVAYLEGIEGPVDIRCIKGVKDGGENGESE